MGARALGVHPHQGAVAHVSDEDVPGSDDAALPANGHSGELVVAGAYDRADRARLQAVDGLGRAGLHL
eukprot:6828921-Heterocapsa_arctica.AAC.1